MNDMPDLSKDSLPVDDLLQIDKLCRRFEAAAKAGRKPKIEDFLCEAPEHQREPLRKELEAIQRELAAAEGRPKGTVPLSPSENRDSPRRPSIARPSKSS